MLFAQERNQIANGVNRHLFLPKDTLDGRAAGIDAQDQTFDNHITESGRLLQIPDLVG